MKASQRIKFSLHWDKREYQEGDIAKLLIRRTNCDIDDKWDSNNFTLKSKSLVYCENADGVRVFDFMEGNVDSESNYSYDFINCSTEELKHRENYGEEIVSIEYWEKNKDGNVTYELYTESRPIYIRPFWARHQFIFASILVILGILISNFVSHVREIRKLDKKLVLYIISGFIIVFLLLFLS